MRELLWMAGKAFLIALILTPIIRDIFRSFDVVDRPAQRKVHAWPLPRVGGLAIAIAYGITLLSAGGLGYPLSASGLTAWQLVPGAVMVLVTGLLDDLFSLKPWLKLSGLVAGASIVFWSGLRIERLADQSLPPALAFPATVFWLLLTSNALNLIDGLDGLCAGMGSLSALTLFTAAWLDHNLPLAYATFPLAGALLGFLCYNVNPATVFLGDSGALLVGFLLGCYGMIWNQKASTLLSILVPLLALSIPLLDLSLSVLRRFLRHQPIFAADRDHIHHRLLSHGLSPRQAVWVLCLAAALVAAFALLAHSAHAGKYQGIIIILFCAAAGLGIHKLGYTELNIAGRLLGKTQVQTDSSISGFPALENAADEESWWNALIEAGKALGLAAVRWESFQDLRQEVLAPNSQGAPAAGWSLRIALSETDSVEVWAASADVAPPRDLESFARAVSQTFQANVRGRRKPASRRAAAAS